jgi:MFS transporter, SP family, general alpha glucoside:H+ symporter
MFMLPVNFGYESSTLGNLLAVDAFLVRFGTKANGTLVITATAQQIINAATTVGIFLSPFAAGDCPI